MSKNDAENDFQMEAFAKETVQFAEEYASARMDFAKAKLKLNGFLADAYKLYRVTKGKEGVKEGLAIDKAYLQLIIDNTEAKQAYESMISEEQSYKGLEKVLDARKGYQFLRNDLKKQENYINNQG